jgi:hypothetical protein
MNNLDGLSVRGTWPPLAGPGRLSGFVSWKIDIQRAATLAILTRRSPAVAAHPAVDHSNAKAQWWKKSGEPADKQRSGKAMTIPKPDLTFQYAINNNRNTPILT